MVTLDNGWIQWDGQIGTYHGTINNISYGTHTGHILTPEAFEAVATISLTEDEKTSLRNERDNAIAIPNNPNPIEIDVSDFIGRFTQTEMMTILTVAKTTIQIEVLLFRLQSANKVDLRSPVVITSITALVDAGLLNNDRKNEILGFRINSV